MGKEKLDLAQATQLASPWEDEEMLRKMKEEW